MADPSDEAQFAGEQQAAMDPQPADPQRGYGVSRPPFRSRGPVGHRPYRDAPPRFREPANPPVDELIGEDEEIVAGRHPVEEAFIARRKAVRLLVVPQRRQALEKLVLHATNLRIPIVEVEGGTLTSLTGFDGHQGIALVTDKRAFAGLDDLLARAIERGEPPFVLVLDSLEDPQNFGSLLRTAEAVGAHGVIYPTHRQAPLSPAAVKASAGAVEHLLLVPVDDLAEALTDLHVRGLRIVGSDAEAPLTARQTDLRGPLAVVVGSEGQGLGPSVRRRSDVVVRIPMKGHVESLNAAVAGSILMYEASSQRGPAAPVQTLSGRQFVGEPELPTEPAGPTQSPATGDDADLPPDTDPDGLENLSAAPVEAALVQPDQAAEATTSAAPVTAPQTTEPEETAAATKPATRPKRTAKARPSTKPEPQPELAPEPELEPQSSPASEARPSTDDDALLP